MGERVRDTEPEDPDLEIHPRDRMLLVRVGEGSFWGPRNPVADLQLHMQDCVHLCEGLRARMCGYVA